MENLETLLMQMISYSGDCKSLCIEAMNSFRDEDFNQAASLLEEAEKSLLRAQRIHAQILSTFVRNEEMKINLFVVHAEDQMMSSETILSVVKGMLKILDKKEGRDNG